jgi:hypothetical protein
VGFSPSEDVTYCIAKIVFPLPLPPTIKFTDSFSNPPSIKLSNPLIPVGIFSFFLEFYF